MQTIQYIPFPIRPYNGSYKDLLQKIQTHGEDNQHTSGSHTRSIFGHTMTFNLEEGIPVITERDIVSGERSIFKQSLGELFAFLNGARTQKELESFGCYWWKPWLTKKKCEKRGLREGDMGPGAYGPAWTQFPMPDGGHYNQWDAVIDQIAYRPYLKTHVITPFIPYFYMRSDTEQQKVVVTPCHGFLNIHINVYKRELTLIHVQRSQDVPVGGGANLIQYGVLSLMLSQVTGYKARRLVYVILDAHYYPEKQEEDVKKLLATPTGKFASILLDPEVKRVQDFRLEHVTISDYHPQAPRRIIKTEV